MKISILRKIILFILLINTISFGQEDETHPGIGKIFISDIENGVDVSIATLKQPFSFSGSEWLTVGAIASTTGLLFTVDDDIKDFAINNQSNFNDKVFSIDSFYGSSYTALFTAGLYGIGLFTHNKGIRELGLHASEAFIISGLVTGVLKITFGRRRPYAGDNQFFFMPFQFTDNKYQSLPSGHTTVAFAVSTVMADFSDNILWKSFWYGAAGLTGFARIYHNKHWASDVFLGASIGYFVGKFVLNFNSQTSQTSSSISTTPLILNNGLGLNITYKF